MSKHSIKARENFEKGYNCSQAIFLAFSDVTGISDELSLKISSPFGGGICRLREVCGALSGALMAYGVLYGYMSSDNYDEKCRLYENVQKIALEFEKEFGSIVCRELLNLDVKHDLPIPSVRTPDFYKKRNCGVFIEKAAEILDGYIENNQPIVK